MCGGGEEKSTDSDGESTKYGEPMQYDPDFNGPIKNRSCTDIICCIIFVIFILVWIVVSGLSFKFGNPELLVYPTDSSGNVCGEGQFSDKPYLYFFDLSKCIKLSAVLGCPTPQVCVKKCPSKTALTKVDLLAYYNRSYSALSMESKENLIICQYKIDETKTLKELVATEKCTDFVLESDPFKTDLFSGVKSKRGRMIIHRMMGRCIPFIAGIKDILKINSSAEDLTEKLDKGAKAVETILNFKSVGEKLFADFKKVWPLVIICFVLVMALSLFWIIIMRWVAWIMVWLSIFLVLALLGVACWFTFTRYVYLKNHPDEQTDVSALPISKSSLDTYNTNKTTWLVLGIISAVTLLILFLVILFLRNRIRLATALIQESSKAVGNIMSSLFFPIVPFLLQLGVICLWLAVALHLASVTLPTHYASIPIECTNDCSKDYKLGDECVVQKFNKSDCKQKCPKAECYFLKYEERDIVTWAQVFNLFGLFWGLFFVSGLGEMVLAGAFATWYWTFEKSNVPTFALTQSFGRTLRYHMGSLAFGSLLIAIVRMIRVFLEYIDRKLKEYKDNVATKALMCCLKCCFWCLEKFIKFINRNAYILISIYGKNFCVSAKNAFFLLMRNIARVVVLDKVTDFLLFLGKLTIVAGIGILSFAFFTEKIKVKFLDDYVLTLNYAYAPVIVIVLGSYLIASCFFSVYSMAVDTLFLCFLEDCEVNDGSPEKPYRMSKKLMKILGKKNKLEDPSEK